MPRQTQDGARDGVDDRTGRRGVDPTDFDDDLYGIGRRAGGGMGRAGAARGRMAARRPGMRQQRKPMFPGAMSAQAQQTGPMFEEGWDAGYSEGGEAGGTGQSVEEIADAVAQGFLQNPTFGRERIDLDEPSDRVRRSFETDAWKKLLSPDLSDDDEAEIIEAAIMESTSVVPRREVGGPRRAPPPGAIDRDEFGRKRPFSTRYPGSGRNPDEGFVTMSYGGDPRFGEVSGPTAPSRDQGTFWPAVATGAGLGIGLIAVSFAIGLLSGRR